MLTMAWMLSEELIIVRWGNDYKFEELIIVQ
jgi:hypothetical protein